ncbi:type IV secretion system protein VirB10 [Phenylobacterium sp.]|uniref:type IV secretion system protein VirB10 n=1 Tax=Phenylobacterium sp. TaxID=1871053 RepID=UPI0030F3ECE4
MSEIPAPTPDPTLQRTITPVSGRLAPARLGGLVILAAAILGCGVLVLASWRNDHRDTDHGPHQAARQVVAFEPAPPQPPTLAAPGPDAPALGSPQLTDVPALPQPNPSPSDAPPPASPLIAFRQGAMSGSAAPAPPAAADAHPTTDLDGRRKGSAIGLARATRLPDRNFLILAGSTLPCILQTAMSSTTPGYVSCLIPRDVLSATGGVVLLEKGTRVMGEYRANLRQGQRRLFVLWTRAVTPGGVAVSLASPAADALGRAGFDGQIDTHFWDRFGAGLLLSVVDEGGGDRTSQGHANSPVRTSSEAAAVALQASLDIPPTLTKSQGAEVSIFVAQDLDFSGVYDLADR